MKKYNVKDLEKVKIIIRWQVIRDFDIEMLKIDQSAFINNVFKSKNITDYYFVNNLIKAKYFIDMQVLGNYEEAEIKPY